MSDMRRLAMVLVCLSAAACGAEATPAEKLEGSWATPIDGCTAALTFLADGRMEADTICPLTDGSIGLDAVVGSFTATGTEISFAATSATCPPESVTRNVVWRYDFLGDSLRVFSPTGGLVLNRITPGGGNGAVITFGCFTGDTFTARPVTPL